MKNISIFFFILSFLVIKSAWSQDTIVLQPGPEGKDAHISDYAPDDNNGISPKFACMAWTHGGTPASHRGVIDFDLSMIPPGGEIIDARLNLFYVCQEPTYVPQTGENESYLQLITEEWDEETVTWNNQPSITTEDQVYLPNSTEPEQDYTNIDVTVLVSKMYNEPENYHGFLLRLITEEYYRCLLFASSDYMGNPELRPKLEIVYISCEPPTVDFEYQVEESTVSFSGISPSATSWHWDFGDGDTSDLQNPQHIYLEQGNFQVCLRVEDACYFAQHCEIVDLCDVPPPVSEFTYLINGLTASFQDASILADEYFWDFGDGYFSSLSNPAHTYDMPGEYQVCLTTWNTCGSDTTCEVLDLCMPVSAFTYEINNLTVNFQDGSIIADEYFWDFGDGYYSNLSDPWHHYELPGNYLVCLQTMNECGSDTACEMLDLTDVSITENGAGSYLIYPNPAREEVFIKPGIDGLVTISILDLSGKEVLLQNVNVIAAETITIPLGQIEPGIYIVRFDSGKNRAYRKLVVVR
jgi:PKD repeat protein